MEKHSGTTRRQFLKDGLRLGALVLAHPLLSACAGGPRAAIPDYSRTISQMTPYIEQQMAENQVTGAAIALIDDQRVVWARGFGYADAANGIPVTTETPFGIGSASKTFTAAMIMQLVERGRLGLDDPLARHISRFSLNAPLAPYASAGGPITIRTILTQHSGIPGDLMWYGVFPTRPHPEFNARVLDYLPGDYALYPTDYFFAYSNSGVGLLADVIAAASGVSFIDYSNVFLRSLGMNRSSFERDAPAVAVGQTKTYARGMEFPDGYIGPIASGAMLSSVSDMAKYIRMIHAGGLVENTPVLGPATLEAMLTPQNASMPLDFDFRIGFIWWLVEPELAYAGRICQHGGDTTLSHTALKILRDLKLGVVVLTNSNTGSLIKENVAIKALQLAVEEKTGMRPPTIASQFSPRVSLTPEALDALAGVYIPVVPAGLLYAGALDGSRYDRIARTGSELTWTQNAGSTSSTTQTLVPRANGRFSTPDSQETEYGFETVSGRRVIVAYCKGFRLLSADRYDPMPIPASWTARVGTYAIADMDSDYVLRSFPGFSERAYDITLRIGDGLLLMNNLPLAPVSDTRAYKPGLARDLGTVVRVVDVNGEEQIEVAGYRYRKA